MDLSNKSLALLLLAAIVISLGGTLISLNKLSEFTLLGQDFGGVTGRATDTGTTQLVIQGLAGCAVDTDVDFGTGTGGTLFSISTDATNPNSFNDCASNAACTGMEINNTGNVNINVTFNSSVNGTGFLGGPAADSDFLFQLRNGTASDVQQGCVNQTGATGWGSLQNVPLADTLVCANLTFTDVSDMMTIEYNVTIRPSTPTGTKTATINIGCNQV